VSAPRRKSQSGPSQRRQISRLMLFFALVYIVGGLGQTGGLIAQPLN
jgi:hypothetical protein